MKTEMPQVSNNGTKKDESIKYRLREIAKATPADKYTLKMGSFGF
jgi:hypothetical protein